MKLKYTASALLIVVIASVSAYFVLPHYFGSKEKRLPEQAESCVCEPDPAPELPDAEYCGSTPEHPDRVWIAAAIGARVTEISQPEYQRLLADSCNRRLVDAPEKIRQHPDSLTISMRNSTISLLNLPYGDLASDFCIEWDYEGYDPARGLHFFSYSGYEAWGYYIADDATGHLSKYLANQTPLFCAASDLFATMYEDPYEGEAALYIYKLLPGGRIVRIATCNRDVSRTASFDLHQPIWIGANSLIALRTESGGGMSAGYVRIDIDLSNPENDTPAPAPEWTHEDANSLVRSIKQRSYPT